MIIAVPRKMNTEIDHLGLSVGSSTMVYMSDRFDADTFYQHTYLFSIISQTRHDINNMAAVVDPYVIVDQCLEWIGFGIPNQRASISTEACFNSLDDLNDIDEKDIRDMADSFQKRTIANRINFGMRRTKWLIAVMHWVQDFYHCSKQPTIDDFVTANDFKQALSTAAQRASLHKVDTDQVSMIPGVYGVPLSYVIRENQAPDHMRDFEGDFTAEIIACATLDGPKFRADARNTATETFPKLHPK